MPRLSVLMTARNAQTTIARAITSTLRAMPRDSELVVLDDASQDGTTAAAAAITDRRIRLLRSPENIGYAAGRMLLMDQSSSEFTAVMDADDVTLPWRFAVQLAALRSADLVVSPVFRFEVQPTRIRPPLPLPIRPEAMALYLIAGCPLSHPTLTARRAALDSIGGYRDVVVEDYDLYLRAVTAGLRMRRTAIPALAYRIHSSQTNNATDFHRRAQAQQAFQDGYAAFVAAEFGPQTAALIAEFDGPLLRRIIDSESSRRGLGGIQRKVLDRYLRSQLPSWG